MLRADNVICGTSTTGTGPLTLAACPSPPGGLDFYKWLSAPGVNFVSGNAVPVSYTIIEYTDSTLVTAKQTEKGVGILTLGASITAATLTRTKVQSTVTGLNTSTPTPSFSGGIISSAGYNPGNGLVTLTMAAPVSFSAGTWISVQGLAMYDVTGVNGAFQAASASGTTVTYTALAGMSGPLGGGFLMLPISIGAAANTMIFVAPSASDAISFSPFPWVYGQYLTGGVGPLTATAYGGETGSGYGYANGSDYYWPFVWTFPMLVRACSIICGTNYVGTTSNAYARIYAVGYDGNPGKLLLDMGVFGTPNASWATAGTVYKTAPHPTGFYLNPGEYYLDLLWIGTGITQAPMPYGSTQAGYVRSGRFGAWAQNSGSGVYGLISSGGSAIAPDPANISAVQPRNAFATSLFNLHSG